MQGGGLSCRERAEFGGGWRRCCHLEKRLCSVQSGEGFTFQAGDVTLLTSFLPTDTPRAKAFPKTLQVRPILDSFPHPGNPVTLISGDGEM